MTEEEMMLRLRLVLEIAAVAGKTANLAVLKESEKAFYTKRFGIKRKAYIHELGSAAERAVVAFVSSSAKELAGLLSAKAMSASGQDQNGQKPDSNTRKDLSND